MGRCYVRHILLFLTSHILDATAAPNLFQTTTTKSKAFCPFPSRGRLPIKSLFLQRIQRAAKEAFDTHQLLVQLCEKLCQQTTVRQIQQVQTMAADELRLLRETSRQYLDLLDQVDRDARILTHIPTIGKPFAVLQKPIKELNRSSRRNITKLFTKLDHQLLQVLATQKLSSCNDSIDALKQVYPRFSSVLTTAVELCDTLDHHVDVIPLSKEHPTDCIMTTDFHAVEINVRHEQLLFQKAVQPINHASAYLNSILQYRGAILELTVQLKHAMAMLLPIHQFAQDFFDFVGGPVEKGGKVWLEWFFGGGPNMNQYETDAAEWMVPEAIQKQLVYAANHLDPFAEFIQPLEVLLKEHLSRMKPIDELNDTLRSLLQSDYIDHLQDCQSRIAVALHQLLTRLHRAYTGLRFCVMTLAAVIVPLDLTNLVVGFLPAQTYSSWSRGLIVVPTVLKLLVDTLSIIMATGVTKHAHVVSFWTILPYVLLLSDVLQDKDDHILLTHVAAILVGIFGRLHHRVLLRALVNLIPALIPTVAASTGETEKEITNNQKTKRRKT